MTADRVADLASVSPVGLKADAARLALDMVAANTGTVSDRRWARAMLNLCCDRMAASIRRTQHCACLARGWGLEVLHRPEGLSVAVHPRHRPECRAIELAAQRRQREATDRPPPADYPPPAS